jgi:GTP-binding protein Era
MRFGTVTLVGRTNVGKSTFLNWALGQRLAIASPLPQTTRDTLLGVATRGDAQIAFLDTPGLHRPRTELGRRMNAAALDASRSADLVVMVTDVSQAPARELPPEVATRPAAIRPGDEELFAELRRNEGQRRILLINKVDLAKDKTRLLPMLEAYEKEGLFEALVPISLLREVNLDVAMNEIASRLPEGPPGYESDVLTNRPVLFFVREYIREAILNQLRSEVPHAVAVSIDQANEQADRFRLAATIHVEKIGQRKIVVGQGGERIKAIGIAARKRIEELVEKKVHLELFVRVSPRWKDMPRQLTELGYDAGTGGSEEETP